MPSGKWSIVAPGGTLPAARQYAGLSFDGANNKVILFGGSDAPASYLADTWHYTPGGVWTQLSPAASPSSRFGHAMGHKDGVPFVFGGEDNSGLYQQDLYKWDGATWTGPLSSAGDYPDKRIYAAGAAGLGVGVAADFDFIIYGGFVTGLVDEKVWSYSIADGEWYSILPYTRPAPRQKHSMYLDTDRNTVIMFGGAALDDGRSLNDMWEWDGVDWSQLHADATVIPSRRQAWQGFAFDEVKHRHVLAPVGVAAEGSITCMPGEYFHDGDKFEIDDGINTVVPIYLLPTVFPTMVIPQGAAPATTIKFDLTDLLGTTDLSGTDILMHCLLTDTEEAVTSTYSGGINYVESTSLLGQSDPPSNQPSDYFVAIEPAAATYMYANAGGKPTVEEMAARIVTVINGATGAGYDLDIAAIDNEDGTIVLYNEVPGEDGNTTSIVTITSGIFDVTNMSGAVTSNWSYNRSGGLWTEYPETDTAPLIIGASLVYDPNADALVLFGGSRAGTLRNEQYEWVWSLLDISPLYSLPGTLQGRIQPQFSQATDGTWVMSMGTDIEHLPEFMLDLNDEITVAQDIYIAEQKLIRFDWRMRFSPNMPQRTMLLENGTVDFRVGSLIQRAPATPDGLIGIKASSPIFLPEYRDWLLWISGSANVPNNGVSRISAVPSEQGDIGAWGAGGGDSAIQAGMVAVIEDSGLINSLGETGISVELLGARWIAELYINDGTEDVLVAQLIESTVQGDPDGWLRRSLAANVSKMALDTTLTFKLRLEGVPSFEDSDTYGSGTFGSSTFG